MYSSKKGDGAFPGGWSLTVDDGGASQGRKKKSMRIGIDEHFEASVFVAPLLECGLIFIKGSAIPFHEENL